MSDAVKSGRAQLRCAFTKFLPYRYCDRYKQVCTCDLVPKVAETQHSVCSVVRQQHSVTTNLRYTTVSAQKYRDRMILSHHQIFVRSYAVTNSSPFAILSKVDASFTLVRNTQ